MLWDQRVRERPRALLEMTRLVKSVRARALAPQLNSPQMNYLVRHTHTTGRTDGDVGVVVGASRVFLAMFDCLFVTTKC